MREQIIELTDGSKMSVKVNFGTLYYLSEVKGNELAERLDKKKKKKQKISYFENMQFAAKIIYAILRSNGKLVTFDEAMALVPVDTEQIEKVVDVYRTEIERLKKKQESKQKMKNFVQK